ncbi:hypothetical protein BGZ57DRAFT_494613 [Hyaloscypha finlandica]|nr:hypothetical protein BGZ57DRAFT_494613 [Hyaloscypha finlandica]
MADSRKQHRQHKQHSLMQPNSKTGRRLTALPVALRHNGPWRYTTVEYMMGRGTACSSRGADAGCRCQSMPQRPQRFNITAHRDQWSVRRPEESLRNAGSRASHSQPAIPGEAVSPLFPRRRHSAVLNAAAASEKGGIWAERRSEESEALGCVDPCCGVQAQPLLPPSGLRKSEATWLWWPGRGRCFVVVVFVFVAVSRLSPLDASTSTFLLAFPWRFSWRST